MPSLRSKISLTLFVIGSLLVVGLVPTLLTGWLLSDKSARELRSAENRYQIQLVQEKARQIELFGQRFDMVVESLSTALKLSKDPAVVSSAETEAQLGTILRKNPDLLALSIKPIAGESLSVFRPGIDRSDVDKITIDSAEERKGDGVWVGSPYRILSSGAMTMPFSAEVKLNGMPVAEVVAVASLKDIGQSVVGIGATSEDDLWNSGLPIVFVVDSHGNAIFHPDRDLVAANKPMNDLKIVSEWLESGGKVQSALVPFAATYANVEHDMIGAYSTARIGESQSFGVITMQDSSKALAIVDEMRWQTRLISLVFALFALVAGLLLSNLMTSPIQRLVTAAKRLAAGDFSTRVASGNFTEISTLGDTFNVMTDRIEEQIANLARAATENRELFVGTVKALAAAIDGKDKYTRGHSERVARISVAIGRRMKLDEHELETLRISALLHDVGKIAIDDAILKKPAALTPEEYDIMKTHPQRGYKIMSQIPAMKEFLPGMYMHHEMVNGKGYPQGLTGDQIPLQAKIVSVADTFDAMTIDRPYSKGMRLSDALVSLRELVGTRYESSVVEALVEACESGEVANGIVRQMAAIREIEAQEKPSSPNTEPANEPIPVTAEAEEEELLELAL